MLCFRQRLFLLLSIAAMSLPMGSLTYLGLVFKRASNLSISNLIIATCTGLTTAMVLSIVLLRIQSRALVIGNLQANEVKMRRWAALCILVGCAGYIFAIYLTVTRPAWVVGEPPVLSREDMEALTMRELGFLRLTLLQQPDGSFRGFGEKADRKRWDTSVLQQGRKIMMHAQDYEGNFSSSEIHVADDYWPPYFRQDGK